MFKCCHQCYELYNIYLSYLTSNAVTLAERDFPPRDLKLTFRQYPPMHTNYKSSDAHQDGGVRLARRTYPGLHKIIAYITSIVRKKFH